MIGVTPMYSVGLLPCAHEVKRGIDVDASFVDDSAADVTDADDSRLPAALNGRRCDTAYVAKALYDNSRP